MKDWRRLLAKFLFWAGGASFVIFLASVIVPLEATIANLNDWRDFLLLIAIADLSTAGVLLQQARDQRR